jgi:hypothetical protein
MIGLSAVDTLLSAFTAFLVLSLMIASPGQHSGGTPSERLYLLRVEKTTQPDPRIGAKLLVDATHGDGGAPDPEATTFGGIPDLPPPEIEEFRTITAASTAPIQWSDCAPTTAGKCTALLAMRSLNGQWKVRFRVAGAQPVDKRLPESVSLSIRLIANGGSAACPDQTLLSQGQIVVSVNLSTRSISCGPQ